MKYLILVLIGSFCIFCVACSSSSDSGSLSAEEYARLVSVSSGSPDISENLDVYTLTVTFSVDSSSIQDNMSYSLCAAKGDNITALEQGLYSIDKYENLQYPVISCNDLTVNLDEGTATYTIEYDLFPILRRGTYRQMIFDEADMYLVSAVSEEVYSLGTMYFEDLLPALDVLSYNYDRVHTILGDATEWSVVDGVYPDGFTVPLEFQVTLVGSGADYFEFEFSERVITLSNGSSTYDIPFTIEGADELTPNNIIIPAPEVEMEHTDESENISHSIVDVFGTTDSDNPDIYLTVPIYIKYSDIENFFPDASSCNALSCPSILEEMTSGGSEAYIESVLIAADLIVGEDDYAYALEADMDVKYMMQDLLDMWIGVYEAETNIVLGQSALMSPAALDTAITPIKYEYTYSKGDMPFRDSFAGYMLVGAGVYIKNVDDNGTIVEPFIQGKVNANAQIRLFSNTISVMDGYVNLNASTDEDEGIVLDYKLDVNGSTVVKDKIEAGNKFSYDKKLEFEKEFSRTNNITVVFIPITYTVGARGAIGIKPPSGENLIRVKVATYESVVTNNVTVYNPVGIEGRFTVMPYAHLEGYMNGGIGFNYSYGIKVGFVKVNFSITASVGVGINAVIADVDIRPQFTAFAGVGTGSIGHDYLAIQLDFGAPLNYQIMQGSIYIEDKLNLKLVWDIIKHNRNTTLAQFQGPRASNVNIITPINATWAIEIPEY